MLFSIVKKIVLQIIFSLLLFVPTNTLRIGFVGHPTTFLPHEVKTDSERTVSDLVFRKMFKYEEGKLVPDLIDSWESFDNNTKYKFRIKKDAIWQDGKQITSDDILYSLTLRDWLRNQIEIEKISDKEVLIKLPNPNAILPSLLTFGIEPAHLKGQSRLKPIGSTSYRIVKTGKERHKTNSVVLQSVKKHKPYHRLVFHFYDTQNNLVTGYKLGEISVFLSPKEVIAEGLKRKPVTYIGRYYALLFNLESDSLSNVDIRKKLVSSISVESFLKENNYTNSVVAQGVISYSPYTREKIGTKTKEDNSLLPSELDLLSGLKVVLPNNQDGIKVQKMLEESWGKKLGVKLSSELVDQDELSDIGRKGDFDVLFIGHEVTPDPDRYSLWHSTQIKNGLNFGRLSDLRADKALEEGRKTNKPEERKKHYYILQDVFNDKFPAIFLYHPGEYLYSARNIGLETPQVIYYPSEILKNL